MLLKGKQRIGRYCRICDKRFEPTSNGHWICYPCKDRRFKEAVIKRRKKKEDELKRNQT